MMDKTQGEVVDVSDRVETIETAWIPMKDGRRLAARLFLPSDRSSWPVPAILEYIPYRRRDASRHHDEEVHGWFAAHGYGSVRVDIAGSGDSDGLIEDEYHARELDDALQIIDWLVRQDWCSGAVGMIGISWGGFNGLQVAALRPPALKAVISICSTVDRYADDVHFMGGCLLNDTLDWGGFFFTNGALPPDPDVVGHDRWREIWAHRIDNLDCYPMIWMEHQRREAFWKHGSVSEDYGRINIPVLNVSGWVDGYTNAVFRCVENIKGAKGIAGPWGHMYPHIGVPGPAIGFLQECLAWWDRWLKGMDNGVDALPDLRVFVQESEPPRPHADGRRGRWIGFPIWPSANVKPRTYHLGDGRLLATPGKALPQTVSSALSTGLAGGEWCAYSLGEVAPELVFDQREDDGQSLCFDSDVLEEPVAIVGRTIARLRISANRPQAQIAVRLNAILPDGSVERITYGLLNLSHRDSHETPTPLVPGHFYDVAVPLNDCGQSVPKGCRLRLAVSTSYWPLAWPSPEQAAITIDPASSWVEIPLIFDDSGLSKVTFAPVEKAMPAPMSVLEQGRETRGFHLDIENQSVHFMVRRDDGIVRLDEAGTEMRVCKNKDFRISKDGSGEPRSEVTTLFHFRRAGWDAKVETSVRMTSDLTHFHMEADLRSYDDGKPFRLRQYKRSFKRDCI